MKNLQIGFREKKNYVYSTSYFNRSRMYEIYEKNYVNYFFSGLYFKSRKMRKRVTVMFDVDILKKLRHYQARKIKETAEAVSFSDILNEFLRKKL